jgi:hypothetical protein
LLFTCTKYESGILVEFFFNAAIGDYPHNGGNHVQAEGKLSAEERQRYGKSINDQGCLSFEIGADSSGKLRNLPLDPDYKSFPA